MKRKTIWAGTSDQPCEQCTTRTAANFMLRQEPDGRWLCVVCLVENHRATLGSKR